MKFSTVLPAVLLAGIAVSLMPVEEEISYGGERSLRVQVYNVCFSSDCTTPWGFWKTHQYFQGHDFLFRDAEMGRAPANAAAVEANARHLSDAWILAEEYDPDVAVILETFGGLQGETLEREFRRREYRSVGWGCMDFYESPLDICTFVAAKRPAAVEEISLPQGRYLGSGGGAVLMHIPDEQLSIIGAHVANVQRGDLRDAQIRTLVDVVMRERSEGNRVILAGDLNDDFADIMGVEGFSDLDLRSAQLTTYPSWRTLGALSPLDIDHVLYSPDEYDLVSAKTVRRHSDHLALIQDLARK